MSTICEPRPVTMSLTVDEAAQLRFSRAARERFPTPGAILGFDEMAGVKQNDDAHANESLLTHRARAQKHISEAISLLRDQVHDPAGVILKARERLAVVAEMLR